MVAKAERSRTNYIVRVGEMGGPTDVLFSTRRVVTDAKLQQLRNQHDQRTTFSRPLLSLSPVHIPFQAVFPLLLESVPSLRS